MIFYRWLADKLFPVRRTLMEMLSDRGFLVYEADIAMTKDQFVRRFGVDFCKEVLDFSRPKRDDPSDVVHVFFVEDKLDEATLEAYVNKMDSSNITRAIFVVQDKPTESLRNILNCHYPKRLEVFWEQDLMVNITRSGTRYEVLTADQKRLLLEQKQLTLELPVTHKLARYLALVRGDIISVSESGGAFGSPGTFYRVVV